MKGRAIVRGAALAAVFLALALAVTWPALSDVGWWGVHDWVQFYTYYGVPHRAVAKYHELPAWDPYYYGGNLAWGTRTTRRCRLYLCRCFSSASSRGRRST